MAHPVAGSQGTMRRMTVIQIALMEPERLLLKE
jgi:hypothetical protein